MDYANPRFAGRRPRARPALGGLGRDLGRVVEPDPLALGLLTEQGGLPNYRRTTS